jgi:hypothetical protein
VDRFVAKPLEGKWNGSFGTPTNCERRSKIDHRSPRERRIVAVKRVHDSRRLVLQVVALVG